MRPLKNLFILCIILFCACPVRAERTEMYSHLTENQILNPEGEYDIAILTTYSPEYLWSKRIISHIQKFVENREGSGRLKAATLYYPIDGIKDPESIDQLIQEVHSDLERTHPHAVVIVGSFSFSLCADIDSWYHNIPIILIGGQDFTVTKQALATKDFGVDKDIIRTSELEEKYNITTQGTPVYVEETTDLIMTLLPGISTIYYIGGSDPFSTFKEKELKDYLSKTYPYIKMVGLNAGETTYQAVVKTLATSDHIRSAVLFSSWPSDPADRTGSTKISSTLATIATLGLPVFTLRDNGWMEASSDIVGGCFVDDGRFFRHLDQVVRQVLSGVQPRDIAAYNAGNPVTKLNYEKLEDLGCDLSVCPQGTVFIHRPDSYIKRLSQLKTICAVIIILLFLLWLFTLQKSQRALHYSHESIYNMPLEYTRAKIIKDKDGNIADLNDVVWNSKMISEHEDMHKHLGETTFRELFPHFADEFLEKVNEAYRDNRRNTNIRMYNSQTGKHKSYTIVFLKGNMVCIIAEDITNIVKANEILDKARIKAEKADQAKSAFIHNISHEIRTPLNAITGFSQLLSLPGDFCTEEEKAKYREYIMNNTEMLTMVINDLLNLSAIEDGGYTTNFSRCRPNDICRHALRSVEHRVPSKVTLSFTSEADDDFTFVSDGQRIQQILINYLTNACKHTSKGSITVHTSLSEYPGKVTFSVTDTGHGIAEEDAEKIFERYVMLDRNYDGKGLGLYICHQLAELLYGEVKLDTSYTGGARFLLILENRQYSSPEAVQVSSLRAAVDGGKSAC